MRFRITYLLYSFINVELHEVARIYTYNDSH